MIVENSPNLIAPLRIHAHPVDKALSGPAVAYQKNVLLIVALGAHGAEGPPD